MASQAGHQGDEETWERSNNFQEDMVRALEQEEFYDCSFQLFSKQGETKEFKCNKYLLSIASCVFAKMLHGQCKEARLGKDDLIPLHGVTPDTFQCALRFLYAGQKMNFLSVEVASEVYSFAHEFQINSLMHAVNQFFKLLSSGADALPIFDLCQQLNNEKGLHEICKELLEGKSLSKVFKSETWLSVPESTVLEVLQLDNLEVSETEVASTLLDWGRAQVEMDNHDPDDSSKLREKVKSCLKSIRFSQFDNKQFLKLCRGDLGQVLSWGEKFQILQCIIEKNWEAMPAHLCPVKLNPRIQIPVISVNIDSHVLCGAREIEPGMCLESDFCLKVDKRCCFVGLKFIPADYTASDITKLYPNSMSITERAYPMFELAKDLLASTKDAIMLSKECIFLPGYEYSVTFDFPDVNCKTPYKIFKFLDNVGKQFDGKLFSNGDGDLTVTVIGPLVGVQVKELLFKMID